MEAPPTEPSSCNKTAIASARRPVFATALNFLPSRATMACVNSFSSRHRMTKRRQTLRMPWPLSWRKSANVALLVLAA
jgi:hypothetical protein